MRIAHLTDVMSVALAFGSVPLAFIRNDADTLESLQNRLLELKDSANNIQARADAEKRELTEDEQNEITQIFAAFENVEADIERRKKLEELNARTAAPKPRQADPNGLNPDDLQNQTRAQADAARSRNSVPAQPRATDAGKWGFRSLGEYLNSVVQASRRGGTIDPRLIANAPTTFSREGVGEDGGFAVPPDFRTAIVQKVMGEESLLSRTDQQTSSSNSITFPADETAPWDASGGIQAYWESEAGQKQQSKVALKEKTVKLNKIIVLCPVTDELLEDAPAMAGYVNRKAPEKITYKITDAIINGTGAGQPKGILTSAGTIEVTPESGQGATIMFQNIVNMWGRMASWSKPRAVWLMNSDAESVLPYMKFVDQGTGNAVPVYLPPGGLSQSPFGTLYGRPVITSEALPALGSKGDIILADLSQYLSVVKGGGVRQDVSIHLWFDYDVTAFRFVMRVGGQPWWDAPVTRPNGQSTRGFFITLADRS